VEVELPVFLCRLQTAFGIAVVLASGKSWSARQSLALETRVGSLQPPLTDHAPACAVLMVAPVGFQFNFDAATDNHFMSTLSSSCAIPQTEDPAMQLERAALREFSGLHAALRTSDVDVRLCFFDSPCSFG
jgi:hypothetical protein